MQEERVGRTSRYLWREDDEKAREWRVRFNSELVNELKQRILLGIFRRHAL